MYSGDHIVMSASYGIYAARALRLPLLPTLGVAIATNLMDFDHQLFYDLDDGAANSLVLHPLHVYAGCFIFALHWLGLFAHDKPQYQKLSHYGTVMLGGVSLHLTADALAWAVHYSIPLLLIFSGLNCMFLLWMCQRFLTPYYEKTLCYTLTAFFMAWLVVCHLQLALFEYILEIRAPHSRWAFFFNPLLTGIAALSLALFHKTALSSRNLKKDPSAINQDDEEAQPQPYYRRRLAGADTPASQNVGIHR